MDLTEHELSSETLYDGGLFQVKRDIVRLPNENTSQRIYVTHPGAVVIVAVLPNGNVVFERQFRYALREVFIELPAGKIDANEAPLCTGQRELLEETGYTATEWVALGAQHPCIGYSNEVIHIYLARGLTAGAHQRDADEMLEVFELSFAACMGMIESGQITDGKTIIALFLAQKYLQSHGG